MPTSGSPMSQHLAAVERFTLGFAGLLLLLALVAYSPSAQLGLLVGGGLSILNARLLAKLGGWASRGVEETARLRLALVLLAFQLKLGVVAAVIYLALRYLPMSPLWLALGLSLLPAAICARALQLGIRAAKGDLDHHG